jgi:hypothetical protein
MIDFLAAKVPDVSGNLALSPFNLCFDYPLVETNPMCGAQFPGLFPRILLRIQSQRQAGLSRRAVPEHQDLAAPDLTLAHQLDIAKKLARLLCDIILAFLPMFSRWWHENPRTIQ